MHCMAERLCDTLRLCCQAIVLLLLLLSVLVHAPASPFSYSLYIVNTFCTHIYYSSVLLLTLLLLNQKLSFPRSHAIAYLIHIRIRAHTRTHTFSQSQRAIRIRVFVCSKLSRKMRRKKLLAKRKNKHERRIEYLMCGTLCVCVLLCHMSCLVLSQFHRTI